jgi:hypothetical protein
VGSGSTLWSQTSDQPDETPETPDTEAHRALDDASPEHRLRRWLKGMFGGERDAAEEPPDDADES